MTNPSPQTTVLIAIGPEWAPVRQTLMDWVAEKHIAAPRSIAVLDASRAGPSGRVAGWLADKWDSHLFEPGDEPDTAAEHNWAGITELLLDPDPTQADQLFALGIWTRFAGRRDRLRMRVSPTLAGDIVEQAAKFRPNLLALVGEWLGNRLVIVGQDLIATEVTARAFRSLAQPAGDIGLSPWQNEIVQSAIERGLGVSGGHHMKIELRFSEPINPYVAGEARQLLERICHLLDTST